MDERRIICVLLTFNNNFYIYLLISFKRVWIITLLEIKKIIYKKKIVSKTHIFIQRRTFALFKVPENMPFSAVSF